MEQEQHANHFALAMWVESVHLENFFEIMGSWQILPVISGLEDLDLDSSLSSSIRGGLESLTGLVSLTGLGLEVFKTFLKASFSGDIERFFTSSTEFT